MRSPVWGCRKASLPDDRGESLGFMPAIQAIRSHASAHDGQVRLELYLL